MGTRWSVEQVLALAPDPASARAGRSLSSPAPWSGTGCHGALVWGPCRGSGQNPYHTVVDLAEPAYRCSCPSRKVPCKHALGLLLLWAGEGVPDAAEPAASPPRGLVTARAVPPRRPRSRPLRAHPRTPPRRRVPRPGARTA